VDVGVDETLNKTLQCRIGSLANLCASEAVKIAVADGCAGGAIGGDCSHSLEFGVTFLELLLHLLLKVGVATIPFATVAAIADTAPCGLNFAVIKELASPPFVVVGADLGHDQFNFFD
jgi:hypothetical protein